MIKEYIKEYGDKVIIQVKENGREIGYYAGAIKPYASSPMKAKLYKNTNSALNTIKRIGIIEYELLHISNLI